MDVLDILRLWWRQYICMHVWVESCVYGMLLCGKCETHGYCASTAERQLRLSGALIFHYGK